MRKLINLRHLNIHGRGLLSKLTNGIGELTSLKTLPTFIVGKDPGCGIKEFESRKSNFPSWLMDQYLTDLAELSLNKIL